MKMNSILGVVLAGMLVSNSALADKPLSLNEVPAAVRQTINAQNAEVKQIKREVRDGQTVYQVKVKAKGPEKQIYIAENGSIISDAGKGKPGKGKGKPDRNASTPTEVPTVSAPQPVTPPQVTSPKPSTPVVVSTPSTAPAPIQPSAALLLRDLPLPVQRTIKKSLGDDGKIIDLDKATVGGKTVYNVEYSVRSHRYQMSVAEDGTISDRARNVAISLNTLPAAAQKTVRSTVGGGEVRDIDKQTVNGKTVYQVTYVKGAARSVIRVAEDGSLVK